MTAALDLSSHLVRGLALACTLALPGFGDGAAPVGQVAYVKASNTGDRDEFGRSIAIHGDTLVIGAHKEDSSASGVDGDQSNDALQDSGAVYVFQRTGSVWSQQAYLKASNSDDRDEFGWSVDVSGDTIVVGARFEDSDATGVGGDGTNDNALRSGAAYVFVRSGTTWSEQAYIKASNTEAQDSFGRSVAIDGDRLVVGASLEDSASSGVGGNDGDNAARDSGAAYVFERTGTTWSQVAYLKAQVADSGDNFGLSVDISGDHVVVGARLESPLSGGAGAAFVFSGAGTSWIQEDVLLASNADAGDRFGTAVAISGTTILVGANLERSNAIGVGGTETNNDLFGAGAAYVFVQSGSTWAQEAYLKASNTQQDDRFGTGVAIVGDTVVIGAHQEDSSSVGVDGDETNNSAAEAGASYVFCRSGTAWTQRAYLKPLSTRAGTLFGESVGIDGSTVVTTGRFDDSGSTGINADPFNLLEPDSGASFVFDLNYAEPFPPIGFNRCLGDGGNQTGCTDCPCANNAPQGTIGGCLNSASTSTRLTASGSTSVSLPSGATDDLRFGLEGAPPTAFGVLSSGDALAPTNAMSPCFGLDSGILSVQFDGLRCAVQNTRRHGGRSADPNGQVGVTNNPWGGEAAPAAGIANAGGSFVAGQTRFFQLTHRDDPLLSCMRGLNTSQAIEITFAP